MLKLEPSKSYFSLKFSAMLEYTNEKLKFDCNHSHPPVVETVTKFIKDYKKITNKSTTISR